MEKVREQVHERIAGLIAAEDAREKEHYLYYECSASAKCFTCGEIWWKGASHRCRRPRVSLLLAALAALLREQEVASWKPHPRCGPEGEETVRKKIEAELSTAKHQADVALARLLEGR